jgi:hypothetical protein
VLITVLNFTLQLFASRNHLPSGPPAGQRRAIYHHFSNKERDLRSVGMFFVLDVDFQVPSGTVHKCRVLSFSFLDQNCGRSELPLTIIHSEGVSINFSSVSLSLCSHPWRSVGNEGGRSTTVEYSIRFNLETDHKFKSVNWVVNGHAIVGAWRHLA